MYFILLQALVLFKHNPTNEGKEAAERHLLSQMTATDSSQTKTIFVKLKNLTCSLATSE